MSEQLTLTEESYSLSIVEDNDLQLTLSGERGPAGANGAAGAAGPNEITTATTTNLTGFISGNGTNISGATAAASAATANTLVLRDANGGASFAGITLSGTGGSPFTSTLTGGVNFANRTLVLPDASGTLVTAETLANSATITASTAVTVDTLVLRDSAGKILISNADVAGATAYASTATWTYGAGAASAHRTALGLGATGSIAASDPLTLTQTWTNAAVTYTGLQVNVTDSGPSNAASLLMDLRVGGVSRFRVRKDGIVVVGNNASFSGDPSGKLVIRPSSGSGFANCAAQGFHASSTGIIGFTPTSPDGTPDTMLVRDGASGTLAQRNGNAAQESRIYGTYTDTSNYRRLALKMSSAGVAQIVAEGAGSGASANRLEFVTGGVTRMTVAADGNITASGSITGGDCILSGKLELNTVTRVSFGPQTSANPMLVRRGDALLGCRTGTNASDASFSCSNLTASGTIKTGGYTFDTLPTATTGMRAYITDGADIPLYMANAAGGGTTVTPVFYNGTNWINA